MKNIFNKIKLYFYQIGLLEIPTASLYMQYNQNTYDQNNKKDVSEFGEEK